jgi:hypothetical protein
MFVPSITGRSRNDQQYVQICTTVLFYIPAPTCFGSNLPLSGSFWVNLSYINPKPTNVIYMEILVKPEIVTSYIHGLTFGNTESRLFLFAAQCFNIDSMQKVFLCHSCV